MPVRPGLKIQFDLMQFLALLVQFTIGLDAAILDASKSSPRS